MAHTGYRDDDFRPYLHVTEDGGASWRSLASGLPMEPVNVVREDPTDPDLLYVGTDLGIYVSLDRGATWEGLMGGLPTTPIHDLRVHPRDPELVAASHGRGAFVLDLRALREVPSVRARSAHLFEVAAAVRRSGRGSAPHRPSATSGEAVVTFWLAAAQPAIVTVHDPAGAAIRTFQIAGDAGLNVVRWDLLPQGVEVPAGAFSPPPAWTAAGTYEVVLEAAGARFSTTLVVLDG